MRARLAVILYVPCALVLVLLGAAYTGSVARANVQEVYLDRLKDASYLVITARQSLLADDPAIVAGDLERYREVYGVEAAVVDQAGMTWATNGLDVQEVDERLVALAGRRGDTRESFLPWGVDRVVVAEPVYDGGDLVGAVVTTSDAGKLSRGIWVTWGLLLVGGLVTSLLAVIVADRTAGWVLRPARAVDRAMDKIGQGRLDARIPESAGPPELRQVIARFNEMAARVEHLMRRQKEFVSNASHELRNPLNALLLRVDDLALSTPAEHSTEIAHVRAEAARMARILDALLLLADDANFSAHAEPLDVAGLVSQRVQAWRALTVDRRIELAEPAGEAWALANQTALECAVDAVIDNADKFSPAGGLLEVAVGHDDGMVEITVRDHGPGVSPDQLERMTERFWRSPDHSGVRGSGLGLPIASELLATAGGEVRLALPDDGGLQVRLRVPRIEVTA